MKILLIGSGGREHALAWKIAQSQLVSRLVCASSNPGMAEAGDCRDIADPIVFAKEEGIDLVVVGPEQPLAEGLADRLEAEGIPCFGPVKAGATLETSKAFTKEICDAAGVPTARYGHFTESSSAKAFLKEFKAPYVVKADGLAAGKGVIIADDLARAEAAVDELLKVSCSVVIEEFMEGWEVSVFAVTDGESIQRFGSAGDYKRAHDGDEGPNTGGMGAVSPHPNFSRELEDQAYAEIIEPTLRELKKRDIAYRGVLYAGLMITAEGPKLVEYNCRFGDPECQILMRRLRSDVVPSLWGAATGRLAGVGLDWKDEAGVLVTYAAEGYPGAYEKGSEIQGLDEVHKDFDTYVFHAGTKNDGEKILANGGRVLSVTALGDDIPSARAKAYKAAETIDWPEGFYRTDIAKGL
ncbi:phosphoribosylamine--glycine ligase [Parvularcula sp. ZS-1/3]|uniref:Phosphoribosylamine--glycine ligase n=1 Tax=Parvularcula mediterranea TaxID=2732508 RepID=A0A7Y3W473_9PROT|nr:phosphoribosylamine--glycine ligase [Parvularcula mediterranea]NNU15219.1 phosphoribosylamine--glycine ligase [Parvularcula mediterranea]